MQYETVIGLEVHLQLSTDSKAFCGCSTKFGALPNTQACPVCLGFPGSLPVLNKKAFDSAVKVAIALSCRINSFTKFDRKNYYYPDLPKNYQISQYDKPLSQNGRLDIQLGGNNKRIGIRRVHLEEDAGKLMHDPKGKCSMVDFNRSGVPLLEIVSEPDLNSPQEAYAYLVTLKLILEYLNVSTCSMEEGSLRCDANLSLRPKGQKELGTKTEVKNMNTFKGVRSALEFEVKRQMELFKEGKAISQETRLWDPDKEITVAMRTKEEAQDYRYFPEPDLLPCVISEKDVENIRKTLPELPEERAKRFSKDYSITAYDATLLTSQRQMADYFEQCAKLYKNPKAIANWLMGDISAYLNEHNLEIAELQLKPAGLIELLKLMDAGTISSKMSKDILAEMLKTHKGASEIVKEKSLVQIIDEALIGKLVGEVLAENPNPVTDYKSGKAQALTFLVGKLMEKTKGKVNPKLANEILRKKIGAT
ncbi:MAG: Asp-tRNA(Asn)/Glu-tRNA(Gln) amidotransferase subunit GatB [Candidatus Omnitrophota bacterium]